MTRSILFAGLLAAAAVPVLAQQVAPTAPRSPMAMMGDRIDARAEVEAKVRDHFATVDADRDGFITTAEAGAMHGAHHGMKHGMAAGRDAMARDPAAAFDRIDVNRDGMISRDEFAKGREMRIERRMTMKDGKGGASGMKVRGGMMGAMMLKMADADKDGRVSLAEATSGALRHFDMMDSNRDGRLTPDERRSGRATMRRTRTPG